MDPVHLFDRPVASLAGNTGKDMLAVIEVHEIRQVVDFDPVDGSPLLYALFEFLDVDRLLLKEAVAIHANVGGRNSGVPTGSRGVVTVQTWNLVVAGVYLVGKSNRLLGGVTSIDSDARQFPSE